MISARVELAQSRERGGIPLKINGVSKTFAGHTGLVEALQSIDMEIAAGEFVCLLGPSGCGKSTLLGIVAGLEPPGSGSILANGEPIRGASTDRVLLFQEAALFPWLDVQHNVEFGLRQAGVPRKERAAIAQRFIDLVHLQGFERSYIHQLSGGMRQRVAIARALAIDPAVLLMDEPFAALDALTRDRLHAELEAIWSVSRKTILFVTHNVREAVALGDRVLVFAPRPGRIVGEFPISLPRPRPLEDPRVAEQTTEILQALRDNAQSAEAQEVSYGRSNETGTRTARRNTF
ncbi:MAG TPA: ABC transporter ATP-binding protein [Ktedonobacteraceae bacterium]